MTDRNSPFAAELDEVIAKPKRELVDQPREEALKIAQAQPKEPWSTYVPFETGADLDVKVSALGLSLNGTGKVEERTDDKLHFSLVIPVKIDINLFNFHIEKETRADVTIVYVEDGGRNSLKFTFGFEKEQQKNVSIQSSPTERILTMPGGLELPTGVKTPLFPEKVTLKVIHIRRKPDGVEAEAEMAGLPNAVMQATKKAPAAAAKK